MILSDRSILNYHNYVITYHHKNVFVPPEREIISYIPVKNVEYVEYENEILRLYLKSGTLITLDNIKENEVEIVLTWLEFRRP